MSNRISRYALDGVHVETIPVMYDRTGKAREKGIDVRIALDVTRLATKGLFDVAIIVSGDSDLDEPARDVYNLRDDERWIAVENAQPWSPRSHVRWLPSARRHRRIDAELFDRIRDNERY